MTMNVFLCEAKVANHSTWFYFHDQGHWTGIESILAIHKMPYLQQCRSVALSKVDFNRFPTFIEDNKKLLGWSISYKCSIKLLHFRSLQCQKSSIRLKDEG